MVYRKNRVRTLVRSMNVFDIGTGRERQDRLTNGKINEHRVIQEIRTSTCSVLLADELTTSTDQFVLRKTTRTNVVYSPSNVRAVVAAVTDEGRGVRRRQHREPQKTNGTVQTSIELNIGNHLTVTTTTRAEDGLRRLVIVHHVREEIITEAPARRHLVRNRAVEESRHDNESGPRCSMVQDHSRRFMLISRTVLRTTDGTSATCWLI